MCYWFLAGTQQLKAAQDCNPHTCIHSHKCTWLVVSCAIMSTCATGERPCTDTKATGSRLLECLAHTHVRESWLCRTVPESIFSSDIDIYTTMYYISSLSLTCNATGRVILNSLQKLSTLETLAQTSTAVHKQSTCTKAGCNCWMPVGLTIGYSHLLRHLLQTCSTDYPVNTMFLSFRYFHVHASLAYEYSWTN